jgi:membrane-associated protease RseP (regulator of RpoE activity)
MMWVIGVVLFALAILISVALHECGHMWVARATGMKVRRYFVGFGPTLWSTRRPNKLGYTEYGVKAVPLGGFCDIAGMTAIDEIALEDRRYAMYKQKTWKRAAVLFAGPGMNFVIGLVLIYGIAVTWGLPSLKPPPAVVGQTSCVTSEVGLGKSEDCFGPGPAALAGVAKGDAEEAVRAQALDMLRDIALEGFEGIGEAESLAAVDAIAGVPDGKTLIVVAKTAPRAAT